MNDKIEEIEVEEVPCSTPPSPEELLKKIVFEPSQFEWKNILVEQPEPDRWVILWCNVGTISQNFFVSYRDISGQYELPPSTRAYPVRAWAYLDIPKATTPEA